MDVMEMSELRAFVIPPHFFFFKIHIQISPPFLFFPPLG